jgi:signal transduction histidine kinase
VIHWLKSETARLYNESIVYRVFGKIRIRGKYPFDDRVASLLYSPLGMFFYNQRAIFFGIGLLFILGLYVFATVRPSQSLQVVPTTLLLFGVWLTAVVSTLFFHNSFQQKLYAWAIRPTGDELPPMFDRYFLLDFVLIIGLVIVGRVLSMPLEGFAFLLFANTIVWSAYIGGGRHSNPLVVSILLLILVGGLFLFFSGPIQTPSQDWFHLALYAGPLIGMSFITIFCVVMIARLRNIEHRITQGHLMLLGQYEEQLSIPPVDPLTTDGEFLRERYSEQKFHMLVSKVLESLCSLGWPFWYHRACLLFLEEHQDRGELFLPGPRFKFDEGDKYVEGVEPSLMGFIDCQDLTVYHPSKYSVEECSRILEDFRPALTAPAAFIPLRQEGKRIGVLALYGKESGVHMQRPEEAFLRSLGSIISNTMQQWAGRYKTFPQREMDDLFQYQTLEEVFPRAAQILRQYLIAKGCMVIFRRDPKNEVMEIVAKEGFTDAIFKNKYVSGRGQTGMCSKLGLAKRRDDVSNHDEEFDVEYLKTLAEAHKAPIVSWMAIPIGPSDKNYGVIKVVNSEFRCSWFTEYDESLGKDLALRLQVIIEKFLQIKETEEARARAQEHAEVAEQKQQEAEGAARQRQEDLMTITHQLQGPLIPVIGTLSGLVTIHLPANIREKLEHVQALVEDAFTLSYGTFTTFALEADQKPDFGTDSVNAKKELEALCERLQKTNARQDLSFYFEEARGFPTLQIDRNILICVLYSLIHNAMKYADKHSEVTLECGFEYPGNVPVLKVKSFGEPIGSAEKELIFKKFQRGRAVTRGRHHTGVGLGLWVARELMRYIGGDLTVEVPPNHPKLSVFIVSVPQLKSGV